MKTKILITVRGGMIQCISTNTPDVEITVADYDNLNGDEDANLFTYFREMPDGIMLSDEVIEGQIREMEEDQKTYDNERESKIPLHLQNDKTK